MNTMEKITKSEQAEQKEQRKPIIEQEINLSYSKGIYRFFTKTCTQLFLVAIAILNTVSETVTGYKAFELVKCIWIVNHMDKKLEGICSVSSSVHDNFFCKCRQKITDCICRFCYAYNQQTRQTGLKEHNIVNGLILRNVLIPVSAFKALTIIFPYLRIESFGDTANIIQARNYIRIIKAFPKKRCAIWSKNIEIYYKAFKLEGKPKNTTYVHSSSKLNIPDNIDTKKYDFVDHIFTVYEKKFAQENNIVINCGGKKCIECIKARKNCYFRNNNFYVNELKK